MARVNVEVGATPAPNFKSTLENASAAVGNMAAEMRGPLFEIAKGASAATVAFHLFREVLVARLLGPIATLVVGIGGISGAFWLLSKASGAAAKGLEAFSTIKNLEGQFRPLLGTLTAARERIAGLAQFAASTPFELPETADASKTLEVLTRGALSTGEGLRMVGDLAAQSGRPIGELATWVGRLYDGLQSGRPVGEAMMRLQELGLVSGTTRNRIEDLQKAGVAGNEIWKVMVSEFDRAKGSMDILSRELDGLKSNYEDTKRAFYARMGKSVMEQEKEAVSGSISVFEKLAPIAETVLNSLVSLGLVKTPGQWVPVFDNELKSLAVTILSAKEAVIVFWRALLVLGTGLAVAAIAGAVTSTISFVAWMKRAATESRAFVAAKMLENQQWSWSIRNIKANTIALSENLAASGRSRVAAMAQAAAMTTAKTAAGYLSSSLRGLAATLVNPYTVILMLTSATWQWINSMEEANKKASDLNDSYNEMATGTAQEISNIQTISDKTAFLAAQYEKLRSVREQLSKSDDQQEIDHLRAVEQLISIRIRQAALLRNSELKAGADRVQLVEELGKLEKEYAESKMSTADKIAAKERELLDLQKQRAAMAENASKAEKAAGPAAIADIEKQIRAQNEIILASKKRVENLPIVNRSNVRELKEKRTKEEGIQNAAHGRIAELQQSNSGLTANEESSKTALQGQDNKIRAAEIEREKLKDTYFDDQKRIQEKRAERFQELEGSRAERRETLEERRIQELPPEEKAAALRLKRDRLLNSADAEDAGAAEEGDEEKAHGKRMKAEGLRKQADQLGFEADDTEKSARARYKPQMSSLAKIGGALGESMPVGPTKKNEEETAKSTRDIHRSMEKIETKLDALVSKLGGSSWGDDY